jgi:putative transposase
VQDKLFWAVVLRSWSGWKRVLVVVTPETVVRWHRAGFRLYWTWLSRHQVRTGRKRVSREVRELIFRMLAENPAWDAPRIHGELQDARLRPPRTNGLSLIQQAPRNPEPAKRWLTFLRNHRELIAAMDFFTVPTLSFGALYCFFVVAHDRRRILHFNVTQMPTSSWVVQQLREAFPYDSTHKYLIFDRDAKFDFEVIEAVKAFGSKPIRTSFRSPWQNGVAERWIESCRRDLLDHVIVLNAKHLKRLLSDYMRYYHEDRTHLGLQKQTPAGREISSVRDSSPVVSLPRIGRLHHRYNRAA